MQQSLYRLARCKFFSPSKVFQQFISPELINSILDDICMTDPEAFVLATSHGKSSRMKFQRPMCIRPWHAGFGFMENRSKLAIQIKSALEFLQERSPSDGMGFEKLIGFLASSTYWRWKQQRCKNLQASLSTLGETLCGDETLFRFTGMGGIVRKVPSKPAKIGIWHYQALVFLPTVKSFLVSPAPTTPPVIWKKAQLRQQLWPIGLISS